MDDMQFNKDVENAIRYAYGMSMEANMEFD